MLDITTLKVTFSETLDVILEPQNGWGEYFIISGIGASGTSFVLGVSQNDNEVILLTKSHTAGATYNITVSGVYDVAGNIITTNNTAQYTFSVTGVTLNILSPPPGFADTLFYGQGFTITWNLTQLGDPT